MDQYDGAISAIVGEVVAAVERGEEYAYETIDPLQNPQMMSVAAYRNIAGMLNPTQAEPVFSQPLGVSNGNVHYQRAMRLTRKLTDIDKDTGRTTKRYCAICVENYFKQPAFPKLLAFPKTKSKSKSKSKSTCGHVAEDAHVPPPQPAVVEPEVEPAVEDAPIGTYNMREQLAVVH